MREALERDLRELSAEFVRMMSLNLEQLSLAGKVLLEREIDKIDLVHEIERRVDELEVKLEAECLKIIARHQPVAGDLRLIAAILKSLARSRASSATCTA